MNISYTLGEEDLIRFNLFHLTKHPKSQPAILIQQGIVVVLLLIYIWLAIARQDLPLIPGILIFFVASAVGLLAQYALFKFLVTRKMKKILAREKDHQHYGQKSMRFDEDRLVETTRGRHHTIAYNKLYTSIETKRLLPLRSPLDGQIFRVLEDFVDAASGLDGPGDLKMGVEL